MKWKLAPALCLDLDGTVRYSKNGEFINGPDDVTIYDSVADLIWDYYDKGWLILGISNQGGVSFGHKTPAIDAAEIQRTVTLLKGNPFHIIKTCYHMGGGSVEPYRHRSLLRKPNVGMLAMCEAEIFEKGIVIDWNKSLFVGDRDEDKKCAENAGIAFMPAEKWRGMKKSEIPDYRI